MLRAAIILLVLITSITTPAVACVPVYTEFPSNSSEIVEVKIGEVYYRFPESFFYSPEHRLPIERDYISIRVTTDFAPLPVDEDGTLKESLEQQKLNPPISIGIRENDEGVRWHSNGTPVYRLTPKTEFNYWGGDLTPDGIRQALKPFSFSTPSSDWAATQELAAALEVRKAHNNTNPCPVIVPINLGEKPQPPKPKPAPPPPIAMEIIEKGLKHKNQAIRERAVFQLRRHKQNPESIINTLKSVGENDKAYVVRMAAIRALSDYDAFPDTSAYFAQRLRSEQNSRVIELLGQILSNSKHNIAAILLDGRYDDKNGRFFEATKLLAYSINHEVWEGKLTQPEQLTPQSRKALDAVVDFYERQDVSHEQKESVANTLQNSRTAIATPRYADWMIKHEFIFALGSMAPASRRGLPLIMESLKSTSTLKLTQAIEASGKFGQEAKDVIPLLVSLMYFNCPGAIPVPSNQLPPPPIPADINNPYTCDQSLVGNIRQIAANAIGEIGTSNPEVLTALYTALGQDKTGYNAGSALIKLEPDREKLLAVLMKHLVTMDQETGQDWIIRLLKELGSEAKPAVPALKRILEEGTNIWTQRSAHSALEAITGESFPEPVERKQEAASLKPAHIQENSSAPKFAPPPPPTPPPANIPPPPPTPPVNAADVAAQASRSATPRTNADGALDTSIASHEAYEKKWLNVYNRKSGDFARYGAWDSGNCYGQDAWMCGEHSGQDTGCERDFPACSSGKAIAVESYPGDGKCVRIWWKWACK